ncbi:hypothetical protein [Paucimonas lemoignei]|nr:hypothetical protein [Paucimonas lemoignei]
MRISFEAVRKWLAERAEDGEMTDNQFYQLYELIRRCQKKLEEREEKYEKAREKVIELAKQLGIPPEGMLAALKRPGESPETRVNQRRPYLNPMDAKDRTLYGSYAHPSRRHKKPQWLQDAEAMGIQQSDCHYKKLEETWAKFNLPVLFNPEERYKELLAEQAPRPKRQPPQRPRGKRKTD